MLVDVIILLVSMLVLESTSNPGFHVGAHHYPLGFNVGLGEYIESASDVVRRTRFRTGSAVHRDRSNHRTAVPLVRVHMVLLLPFSELLLQGLTMYWNARSLKSSNISQVQTSLLRKWVYKAYKIAYFKVL